MADGKCLSASGACVFLTGASGFVGSGLLTRLLAQGLTPRVGIRSTRNALPAGVQVARDARIEADFDWRQALERCEAVIHAAARVHARKNSGRDSLTEYRRINVEGTLRLARYAANAGVRRFVFLSSIKVNGERTEPGTPFTVEDTPAPQDAYAISKYEAEEGLRAVARETGLEVVSIRPVLVYGPGVKANFQTMMRWLVRGVPLPLGAVNNRRSVVGLENLADLVVTCVRHPGAVNQTLLVSDGEDLSTADLLRQMAAALGRPARLFALPTGVLRLAAAAAGKGDIALRLLDSLQVDIEKTRRLLGWAPRVSTEDGLRATAAWFLAQEGLSG